MKKNKKLIKRIGCLIGAFMVALVSICSIIPNKKQNVDYASADTVYSSYRGSPISIPYFVRRFNNGTYTNLPFYVEDIQVHSSLVFNLYDDALGKGFSLGGYFASNTGEDESNGNLYYADFSGGRINFVFDSVTYVDYFIVGDSSSSLFYRIHYFYYYAESSFDLSKLSYFTINTEILYQDTSIGYRGNFLNYTLTYYDSDNDYVRFSFQSLTNCAQGRASGYPLYNNNTYNLVVLNDSYYQGYNIGQTEGYNSGYNTGYNTGKSEGQSIGYTTGFQAGKSEGLAMSSNYTFMSLFSAIFDAPIQALTGLFNFDVLGVNLYNFLTGLFTLAVIIMIIRLVL